MLLPEAIRKRSHAYRMHVHVSILLTTNKARWFAGSDFIKCLEKWSGAYALRCRSCEIRQSKSLHTWVRLLCCTMGGSRTGVQIFATKWCSHLCFVAFLFWLALTRTSPSLCVPIQPIRTHRSQLPLHLFPLMTASVLISLTSPLLYLCLALPCVSVLCHVAQ